MGTFAGHIVPGSCFILVSIWWCYAAFRNYFKSKCNGISYRTSSWFRLQDHPNLPIESSVKLLLIIFGIMGETVTAFDDNGVFVQIVNGQHITMFFFFGIQAVIEIMQFYNFPALPTHVEYFSSALAFFMQGLLFYFHLHGRSMLDVRVHQLLIVAIAGCCISITMEMFVRNRVMVTLARVYWVLVQGTWFYHVGFILYPPLPSLKRWSAENHEEMMLITMYFAWHCAVDFCIVLLIGGLVSLRYKRDLAIASRGKNLGKNIKSEFIPLNQFESDSDAI